MTIDIDAIKRRAEAATKGPLEIGIVNQTFDPLEWFKEHLSYGEGPIWCVAAPEHPRSQGGHLVLTAIAGNGPASEANATFYASAPGDMKGSAAPRCARKWITDRACCVWE